MEDVLKQPLRIHTAAIDHLRKGIELALNFSELNKRMVAVNDTLDALECAHDQSLRTHGMAAAESAQSESEFRVAVVGALRQVLAALSDSRSLTSGHQTIGRNALDQVEQSIAVLEAALRS